MADTAPCSARASCHPSSCSSSSGSSRTPSPTFRGPGSQRQPKGSGRCGASAHQYLRTRLDGRAAPRARSRTIEQLLHHISNIGSKVRRIGPYQVPFLTPTAPSPAAQGGSELSLPPPPSPSWPSPAAVLLPLARFPPSRFASPAPWPPASSANPSRCSPPSQSTPGTPAGRGRSTGGTRCTGSCPAVSCAPGPSTCPSHRTSRLIFGAEKKRIR